MTEAYDALPVRLQPHSLAPKYIYLKKHRPGRTDGDDDVPHELALFVAGLPSQLSTDAALTELFSIFGPVRTVSCPPCYLNRQLASPAARKHRVPAAGQAASSADVGHRAV